MVQLPTRYPHLRGRASLPHWTSGVKACAPAPLPPAAVALRVGLCEAVKKCDAGKGDECPNDTFLRHEKRDPKRLFRGFLGDAILPSYMGIIINHYEDPYYKVPK